MATITSAGLGSGLDINGIITKLMQVESQPLTAMASKEASYQAKLSAFGSMKGALSSLQTAAKTLATTSTFTNMSASSSDGTLFSVSASIAAKAGSYDIGVTTLAKANSVRTNVNYGTNTFDSGTLRITIGTGTPQDITLTGTNTLSGIRDAINGAATGVTATIVNDGTADRLVLTSSTTVTAARAMKRSSAICGCCGASAAWCTACLIRWHCGVLSAEVLSQASPCRRATSFRKSCPKPRRRN